jgi:Sec-independent protein translocase protein TatA
MKKEHRFVVLFVVLVLVVIVAYFFSKKLGDVFLSLLGTFSIFKIMKKYEKADAEDMTRRDEAEAVYQGEIREIENVERERKIQEHEQRIRDAKEIEVQVSGLQTKEQANKYLDTVYKDAETFLDKHGGFASLGAMVLLLVWLLACLLLGASHAKASDLSAKDKIRITRQVKVVKRLQRLVTSLKGQHRAELQRLKSKSKLEISKRESRIKALEKKLIVMINKPPVPVWIYTVTGLAVGAFLVGVIWGASVLIPYMQSKPNSAMIAQERVAP